jgi:hypothetical protein
MEILMKMGFQELLDQNGIKHFSEREVFINEKPPAELWENIIPTLIVADHFRQVIGKPIKITSAYRNAYRNLGEGGKPLSLHVDFNAIDIRASNALDKPFVYKEIKRLVEQGFILQCYFKGKEVNISPKVMGIGYYPSGYRLHIDTRALIGRTAPARWNG